MFVVDGLKKMTDGKILSGALEWQYFQLDIDLSQVQNISRNVRSISVYPVEFQRIQNS